MIRRFEAMSEILTAISLLFVIEGLMLFISPSKLKQALSMLMVQPEKDLRTLGFCSMVAGALLLYIVK